MDTTFEATDLAETNPTDRDAAAVITPGGTDSMAATPLSATAAIGPNRHARDVRTPPPRRNRSFGRVSALGVGAAHWIVAAAAIGLTALSVALAAPASAHGSHDGGDTRHHHTATGAVHQQADGAKKSTSPSSNTQNAAVDPPASNPPTGSMPLFLAGHDKCKAQKDGAPGPPWCTDPAAGWVQSTLHRTDGSFPTLPGAQAAAETGRAAAGRGAVHAHTSAPHA
jgi:hypothetical protein